MQFAMMYIRNKPATATVTALGSDVVPPNDTPPGTASPSDNILATRVTSINGWPPHRLAVVCRYKGAAPSPVAINIAVYFYEGRTGAWFPLTAAPASITPNGPILFFDIVVPTDTPNSLQNLQNMPGNTEFAIIATDPGTASVGEYDIAAAVDLTTA